MEKQKSESPEESSEKETSTGKPTSTQATGPKKQADEPTVRREERDVRDADDEFKGRAGKEK